MHRSLFLLCLTFVCVHSQNIHKIENLMKSFTRDEESLWKIINYYDNDATRSADVKKVLEFYEIYMGMHFGEIGIFQMISKQWLNENVDGLELMKHITIVNATFDQAFALVKSKNYGDIIKFVSDLPQMILVHFSTFLLDRMGEKFWKSIRSVKIK